MSPRCHIYFGYCQRMWQTKMQCRCNLQNLLRATMPSNTFHYRALGSPRHTSQSLGQRLTTIRLTHTMSSAIVQSLRVWPYQQVFTTNNTTDNVLSDGAADARSITRNQGTATPARNAGTSSAKIAKSSGTTSSTVDHNSTSTTTSSASPHGHLMAVDAVAFSMIRTQVNGRFIGPISAIHSTKIPTTSTPTSATAAAIPAPSSSSAAIPNRLLVSRGHLVKRELGGFTIDHHRACLCRPGISALDDDLL